MKLFSANAILGEGYSRRKALAGGCLFLFWTLVGFALVGIVWALHLEAAHAWRRGERTTANVLETDAREGLGGRTVYRVALAFERPDGSPETVRRKVPAEAWKLAKAGETAAIRYDPDNPSSFVFEGLGPPDDQAGWLFALTALLLACGGFCALMFAACFLAWRAAPPTPPA